MPEATWAMVLADEVARELLPPAPGEMPERDWLQAMRDLARQELASATCARPQDHLDAFVAQVVPTLTPPFVIYGAGTIGRRIAAACAACAFAPVAFVETAPADQDRVVDGLPVWTPRQACAAGIRTVVLGTLASADAMRAELAEAYGPAGSELRCEAPMDLVRGQEARGLDARLQAGLEVVACGRTLGEYLWLVRHADERMDAAVPVNRTERRVFHLDRYRFAGRFAAGRHILDCASGTGYGSGWLARQAAPADVLGIEIDAEAVAYASRHYGTSRAAFTQGDACQLDALEGGSRDLVVSFETIEHVRDDVAMLRGFARVLTDDGILVTSTPNDWPVETSPYHVRSYDPAGFERVLRAWFDEVTLWAHVVPSAQARGGVVPWRGQSTTEAECLVAVCRAPRRA